MKNIIHIERNKPNSLADYQQLKEFIFVYTIPDLQEISLMIFRLYIATFINLWAIWAYISAPLKTELYQRLWNDPLVLRFRSQTSQRSGKRCIRTAVTASEISLSVMLRKAGAPAPVSGDDDVLTIRGCFIKVIMPLKGA